MILRPQFIIGVLLCLSVAIVEANDNASEYKESRRNLRHNNKEGNAVAEHVENEKDVEDTEGDRKLRPYNYGYRNTNMRQSNYNRGFGPMLGMSPNAQQPRNGYRAPNNRYQNKAAKSAKAAKSSKAAPPAYRQPNPGYGQGSVNRNPQNPQRGGYVNSMQWNRIPGQPIFLETGPIPVVIIGQNANVTVQNSNTVQTALGGGTSASFPSDPTEKPTPNPTRSPTKRPTRNPTISPTRRPTRTPTIEPTRKPTTTPTLKPTGNPTISPTRNPTRSPTNRPTRSPTRSPTNRPTRNPTKKPTNQPTGP